MLQPLVLEGLEETPAVVLLGPRQAGKTTLALEVARERPSLYLDLESDAHRARLSDPEQYFADHRDRLLVLDEVHRLPGLFPLLRGQIDQARRDGLGAGRYLLLGSASPDLLRQSGESLAGRVAYLELGPFNALEIPAAPGSPLWLRGGFPPSLQAPSDARSLRWRQDFIRTYLERDIPQFSPRLPAESLRRLWTMLAHQQGALLNAAQLARNLGVDGKTVAAYLDLLVDLMLVRRLPPWHANVGKRLVRSPKLYVRDSGIVHALLGIGDLDTLLSHPVVGASWEGHVIDNLLLAARSAQGYFWRTAGGAEIDLLLAWPDGELWAVEVKRSLAPKPGRGFHAGCADLRPARRAVVYPGDTLFPLGEGIQATPLPELMLAMARREGG